MTAATRSTTPSLRAISPTLLSLIPTALVAGLMTYWFGFADRYAVFLYQHLGATPFDAATRSRYWMSGLVACGFTLVISNGLAWIAGRLWRTLTLPAWWRIWVASAIPLGMYLPLLTMNVNHPTLPPGLAALTTLAALAGLALALAPTGLALRQPTRVAWMALDGLALLPWLLLGYALERTAYGLNIPVWLAYATMGGSLVVSAAGLAVLAILPWRRTQQPESWLTILLAGGASAYLIMPAVHHVLATPPGYKYISTASNFLAFSPWVQVAVWLTAGGLALGASRLQRRALMFGKAAVP